MSECSHTWWDNEVGSGICIHCNIRREVVLEAELSTLKAKHEALVAAGHGVLQADRKLSRPFPNRNNRELYQAIDALQVALAKCQQEGSDG